MDIFDFRISEDFDFSNIKHIEIEDGNRENNINSDSIENKTEYDNELIEIDVNVEKTRTHLDIFDDTIVVFTVFQTKLYAVQY